MRHQRWRLVICSVIILVAIVGASAQQVSDSVRAAEILDEGRGQRLAILVTTIVGFLTTLAGFAYNLFREDRNRKWDREDRENTARKLAEQTEATRAELAERVELTSTELAGKVESARRVLEREVRAAAVKREEIARALEENTRVSENAFHEANSVNLKIADLTREFTEVKRGGTSKASADVVETLDTVDRTTKETLRIVQDEAEGKA